MTMGSKDDATGRPDQAPSKWSERLPFQFVVFLLAGGVAALCNIGARILFSRHFSYDVAIVLAYGVGMVVAFTIMRAYVFRPSSELSKMREFFRFVLVNVVGLAQTLAVSLLIARWAAPALGLVEHAEEIGHVIGVAVPIFTSFVGHKYYSFRKNRPAQVPR